MSLTEEAIPRRRFAPFVADKPQHLPGFAGEDQFYRPSNSAVER
jgi:hypothetical protein